MSDEEKLLVEYLTGIKKLATKALELYSGTTVETPPRTGTAFKDIDLEDVQFDLLGISMSKTFPVKSDPKNDPPKWTKQSLMVTDAYGLERELIAWGDLIDLFEKVRVGDLLDVHCVKNAKEWEKKDKTKVTQYTVGSNTTVERVGEEHVL